MRLDGQEFLTDTHQTCIMNIQEQRIALLLCVLKHKTNKTLNTKSFLKRYKFIN